MKVQLPLSWSEIADDARIWLWASPEKLTDETIQKIDDLMGDFVTRWTSHQVALKAVSKVLHGHFVVVALDQSASTGASGCSIDSLTHQVQGIAKALGVDLFDRSTFFFHKEGQIDLIKMTDIQTARSNGRISNETMVYDTLIKSKYDLEHNWIKPAKDSWHARFL